jgi:hypothetical protein
MHAWIAHGVVLVTATDLGTPIEKALAALKIDPEQKLQPLLLSTLEVLGAPNTPQSVT